MSYYIDTHGTFYRVVERYSFGGHEVAVVLTVTRMGARRPSAIPVSALDSFVSASEEAWAAADAVVQDAEDFGLELVDALGKPALVVRSTHKQLVGLGGQRWLRSDGRQVAWRGAPALSPESLRRVEAHLGGRWSVDIVAERKAARTWK